MEWLTPLVGAYAAAVAVPLLVLLYFLKLKRRQEIVSSTLLWKRAVQDLQVNAPFQRLRKNLLLLLQLLALAAILLALAGPVLSLQRGPGQRYVILIDRSASMNATDVAPSRLADAKRQAKVFIESMRSGSVVSLRDASDHAMVIAFDGRAKVMCNFTSDRRRLAAAIDAIEPGDGVSQLGEALTVARAFSQGPANETTSNPRSQAQLILFSDGRIDDLDTLFIDPEEMIFHAVGQSGDNVAITAMNVRRSYEQPDQIDVFASLANYGIEEVTRDVQLAIDGDVRTIRTVAIPGRTEATADQEFTPGQIAVNFSLDHSDDGILEVRQLTPDALDCDDAAWSVLAPPKRLSVLLVTGGNSVLESALQACPVARLDPCTPAGFDAMDRSFQQPYDVVVLDRYAPKELPRGCYMVFGALPSGIDVNSPGVLENQMIVDWRTRHPILQYVNMMNLFAAESVALDVPRDAEVLAEFNESPAIVLVRRNGSTFLLVGFDVLQSNWPFEPGFVLFCYNALDFLAAQVGRTEQAEVAVGEPIVVEGAGTPETAKVVSPDGSEVELASDPGGTFRFAGTRRVGVYGVDVPGQSQRFYAVNLADADESRIEPRSDVSFSGVTVAAEQHDVQRANVPMWPWLVLIALALVCIEWLAYNAKARI